MSAWIVGQDHIDLLVSGIIALTPAIPESLRTDVADTLGADLWNECHKSVNYRYDESEPTPEYTWTPVAEVMEPEPDPQVWVQVLHNVHCYTYQSCEHPGWKDSAACKTMEALQRELELRLVAWPTEPGFNGTTNPRGTQAAAWGWERKNGFNLIDA